jgi:hypothetical protein
MTVRAHEVMRAWLTDVMKVKGPKDPLTEPMVRAVCLTQRQQLRGMAKEAAERECGGLLSVSFPTHFDDLHASLATRILYFDALLHAIDDEALKTRMRHAFAAHLGWEPRWFRATHDGATQFVLKPVPMEEWPPSVLQLALGYAEGDADLGGKLRAAQARSQPFGCGWEAGALVRETKGGGFGAPKYDPKLGIRPDIAGSGGAIECAEVKKVHSDQAMLAIVHRVATQAIAVEAVEGQAWQVNKNGLGQPTSMTRVVRIYSRVPRADVAAKELEK